MVGPRRAEGAQPEGVTWMIRAVVFDLDGVIISSEEVWDDVRQDLVRERGGRWRPEGHDRMMGMSTPEWTAYMHDELGLDMSPPEIAAEVSRLLAERYRASLPLLPGAVDAVRAASARWPLAVASSSPQELIELVLELAGIRDDFTVVLSSERVPARKARAGRVSRRPRAPGDARGRGRRRRGLHGRHPGGARGRDARGGHPEPHLPARARGARARGRRAAPTRRSSPRRCSRGSEGRRAVLHSLGREGWELHPGVTRVRVH